MKYLTGLALAGLGLLAGCGRSPDKTATSGQTNPAASSGNPITAPVDYLGAVGQAQKQAARVVELVQIQQALRQFHAAEGRYPKDLQELVKEGYLPALPRLPRGYRIEYNPASGQVRAVPTQ